jgi:CheY-like chemotaxis protein
MAHILVVDDNDQVRKILELVIVGRGLTVVAVSSGAEALELLVHHKFDLMVTDYDMPGMNGDVLIYEARKLHSGLPVIMVTGTPPEHHAADILMVKPIVVNLLVAAIKTLVKE